MRKLLVLLLLFQLAVRESFSLDALSLSLSSDCVAADGSAEGRREEEEGGVVGEAEKAEGKEQPYSVSYWKPTRLSSAPTAEARRAKRLRHKHRRGFDERTQQGGRCGEDEEKKSTN